MPQTMNPVSEIMGEGGAGQSVILRHTLDHRA